MRKLKIALLQLAPCQTLEENIDKGLTYCRKAKKMGADIILFPEMWSNGYRLYDRSSDEWIAEAISMDNAFVSQFQQCAKELNAAIAFTLLERKDGHVFNSCILVDRHGEKKLSYAKVHTCDFSVEKHLTPGNDFYVTQLDTECGNIQIGVMICYDREFPESARILMLKGAELILVPNACPMEINRLSQLRSRAYENMVAIATCNYPKNVPDCNGHSTCFDGVAYLPEEEGSRDMCLVEADEQEGIYLAELDLEQLRCYREHEVHGNAYRHPSKYTLLTEKKKNAPFIREDSRE